MKTKKSSLFLSNAPNFLLLLKKKIFAVLSRFEIEKLGIFFLRVIKVI